MKILDFINMYKPDTETEVKGGAVFLCVDIYNNGCMKKYNLEYYLHRARRIAGK